ncbi:MAG: flavodoxin family protein [Chitinispirillales bacterium]|jgi:multimeric flavodoxin WrbA|nr:flavodoxin family protein [Chitinispirillales bacterium]
MNILGISGTPRKGGNSEILLDAALEPFVKANWNVKQILLSEKKIEMCIGCETCVEIKKCLINNDDMIEIYEAYEWCDAIIISAPAYYRNVPAQLKALFDRTFATWNHQNHHPLKGKLGGAISVGRGQCGGQSIVLNIIYSFYLSNGMLCVPGELNGVTAVADKPGDILTQPRRLEQARILGENIINYCGIIKNIK